MQYPDIFNNPQRAANVVPLSQLTSDLSSGHVAQFVWISPNICNDMHGGAPECPYPNTDSLTDPNQEALFQDGDQFINTWVTAIMGSACLEGQFCHFHYLGRRRVRGGRPVRPRRQ